VCGIQCTERKKTEKKKKEKKKRGLSEAGHSAPPEQDGVPHRYPS
jgi:hypothetical protein